MKKKSVNILAILAIVLAVAVIGIVLAFVLGGKDKETEGVTSGIDVNIDLGSEVLRLENIDQFRQFSADGGYECHIGDDLSGGSVYGVPLLGNEAIVTYYFDQQGNTTDFHAFYYLNAHSSNLEEYVTEELSEEQLAMEIRDTVGMYCLLFECNFDPDIYLTNKDGTFTLIETDADYQKVVDGSADLIFSIRDAEGYYWELAVNTNEGVISANVRKFFNIEECKDYVANISLYEEG